MSSPTAFQRLAEFLQNQMRMSHIYQPLMLKLLLEQDGRASTREIAAAFLSHDESQLDYYETITNRMPGAVLKRHGLMSRDGDGRSAQGSLGENEKVLGETTSGDKKGLKTGSNDGR